MFHVSTGGVIAIVMFLLMVLCGIKCLNLRQEKKYWFDEYHDLYSFLKKFVTQDMVDDRLRQLASAFSNAADQQAQALRESIDDTSIHLEAQAVTAAKETFWEACNGAVRWGFKTHKSFKDYLPTKTRPIAN